MPLIVPVYDPATDPRPVLYQFVISVRDFLDELVREGRDPTGTPLFVERLLGFMGPAWEEGRPIFEGLAVAISDASPERLREHGLSGRQLGFKLEVIRYLNEQYLASGKGILRRLLDAIDTLLKSIIKAAGLGDAAEELKDFIKDSIDGD
ncbi:MAG: hypothetical protein JSR91_23490 [Proteobacteria bacterium]|nr:hypothetical protein [Pseudomonadota bacterium]